MANQTNQNNKEQQEESSLKSLQEKLYQPGARISDRPIAPKIFTPGKTFPAKIQKSWTEEGVTHQPVVEQSMTLKQYKKKRLKIYLIIFAIIAALGAAIFGGYVYFFRIFQKSDVVLKIRGPVAIESGENAQFSVSYQNKSQFALEDATLVFKWPEGSQVTDSGALEIEKRLGVIASGREASAVFDGRIFGAKNDKLTLNSVLRYRPENLEEIYEVSMNFEIIINKTPFSIVMTMPPRAVSGKEVEILLEYQNLSETVFDNMRLKLEYPDGFLFSSASPAPTFIDQIWDFDKLAGKEMGKIKITGILAGQEKEIKLFRALFGKQKQDEDIITFASEDYTIQMSSTVLFVYQTVNNSRELATDFGGSLNYKIVYRNTSDVAIPNVVINAKISGKFVDYKSLNIRWGSYSGATNSIIWNSAGLPDLALLSPGEEGEVSFSIQLKRMIDIFSSEDINSIVSNIVTINSGQIPESLRGIPVGNEDKLDVKLKTILGFSALGFYQSPLAPIANSGPIPPRIGQKTTYNIVWQISNNINDIDSGRVEAQLPAHVAWEGERFPQNADLSYDSATGKVVWNIGRIPAGTGYIMPLLQAAFKISIMPGFADAGRTLGLISESVFSGKDSFTAAQIEDRAENKTIDLSEDVYITEQRGGVVAQ